MSNSTLDSLFYILVLFIVLVKTVLTWRSEHVSYLSIKPGALSGSEIVNPEARCATTRQQEVSSLDSTVKNRRSVTLFAGRNLCQAHEQMNTEPGISIKALDIQLRAYNNCSISHQLQLYTAITSSYSIKQNSSYKHCQTVLPVPMTIIRRNRNAIGTNNNLEVRWCCSQDFCYISPSYRPL